MLPKAAQEIMLPGIKRFPRLSMIYGELKASKVIRSQYGKHERDIRILQQMVQLIEREGKPATEQLPETGTSHMKVLPLRQVLRHTLSKPTTEKATSTAATSTTDAAAFQNRKKRPLVLHNIRIMLQTKGLLFDKVPDYLHVYRPQGAELVVRQAKTAPAAIGRACRALIASVNPTRLPSLASIAKEPFEWKSKDDLDNAAQQISDLSEKWRVSPENYNDVTALLHGIHGYLESKVPKLHPRPSIFGSRLYGLAKDTSDVDICIKLSPTISNNGKKKGGREASKRPAIDHGKRKVLTLLHKWMRNISCDKKKVNKQQFSEIVFISHARVPIIKFNYTRPGGSGAKISCDISASGGSEGTRKSKLLQAYVATDPRVRQFFVVLKAWARQRSLSDSQAVNSFGFTMMGLAFLLRERVVPPLQLVSTCMIDSNGWERLEALQSDSEAVIELLKNKKDAKCIQTGRTLSTKLVKGGGKGGNKLINPYFMNYAPELSKWCSPNSKPVIQLLYEMFQLYGCEFDPLKHVVSPRLGSPFIKRDMHVDLVRGTPLPANKVMEDPSRWSAKVRPLVVEDPFDQALSCSRQATCEWTDGLFWEMRRAAWIIQKHGSNGDAENVIDRLLSPPLIDDYGRHPQVWASVYSHFAPIYEKVNCESVDLDMQDIDLALAGDQNRVKNR
ncbi:hypothetical protein GGI23_000104 [Coemansia sp. RSA 2559]|nr:hypothetical protein GGI23_000104 [Coemansia sp. RSA 2559]